LNARERLEQYLLEVRNRLRTVAVARAAAAVAITALAITLLAVWALRDTGYPERSILFARIALILALVAAAAAMLWRPLSALRPQRQARALERHLPGQQGRVETYLELARRREQGIDAPLIDLLAEDALAVAAQSPPEEAVPPKRSLLPAGIGAAALAALMLMLVAGPAFWGFGSRHLWFGAELPKETILARSIAVTPGDVTVRKNQDVPIRATVNGFNAAEALVHVRFGDSSKWERAPMQVGPDGKFEFTVFALREPLSYYVTSGTTRSVEHRIALVEVPRVEKMRLTYTYPDWTGLPSETDETSRDIHVVAGTKVDIEVQTSTPLESPTLMVNGASISMRAEGTLNRGAMTVKKSGTYKVGATVASELVALTDDHEISLIEDQKPSVEVERPGRDWYANSIEEVPVHVRAEDDFRVNDVELRYSLNGGEWKSTPLKARAKDVKSDTMIRLEEMGSEQQKLTPGDIVTYYAVAKDRRQSAQTDLFLVQVMPFDRRFTQGQAGGGGGGMGGEPENAISQRQREILLATWKLQRTRAEAKGREAERLEDNARMLSELQGTLAEQAQTLIERAQARTLTDQDPKIRQLTENLQAAVQSMQPAVKQLSEIKLQEAIPNEQKALQHLLRAESLITEIQVAFQSPNGGGGGAAGRDISEMFELEMDLEKNQYETEARAREEGNSPEELSEAIRKLRELAQRQERLAREAANERQQARERNRWQQEQLRRETEDLRRKLQEMARRESGRQNGSQSGEQSGQERSASNSASEALDQVESALQNMQGAAGGSSSSGGQQGERSAQEASRKLRQALQKIEKARRDGMSTSFDDLAQRAQALVDEQRRGENELHEALTRPQAPGANGERRFSGLDWERAEALAESKRNLQAELQALERDMRTSSQRHREEAPKASERVGEAATNLGESNLGAGLARSAIELERGRAMQAAARDGLISEALAALQNDLNDAAQLAAGEAREPGRDANEASPEELLAELAELRRAWADAQSRAADRNGGREGAADPSAQEGDSRSAQAGGQNGSQSGSPSGGSQEGNANGGPNGPNGTRTAGGTNANGWGGWNSGPWSGHFIEGERGRLNAWNPPLAGERLSAQESAEFQRQAAEIGRRLREMMSRLPKGALPQTDISALRQLADRLRQMNRADPLSSEYERMIGLVDQVELAALGAAEKARADAPTRSATPAADSPGYRDNVAEYYRRLGSGPSTR
jgi:hypothetical protein